MPEHLTFQSFSEQLHTKFRLSPEAEKVSEIELVEVQLHDDVAGQTERFSLVFRGPLDRFLPQRTYRMEQEHLGSVEVFIVPIRQDKEGFYYEAVFNRVK